MEELSRTFLSQLGGTAAPNLVDAKPAPALVFASDKDHEIVLTVRDDQFVLWLDDNTPGSIPSQQFLGPLGGDKAPIPSRVLETIAWMARQKVASGDDRRAIAYLGDVAFLARWAQNADLHRWAVAERFKLQAKAIPVHPTHLTRLANETSKLGMTYENAYIRFLMGQSAEQMHEKGDPGFPLDRAVQHYEMGIEKLEGLDSDEARSLAKNLNSSLARLRRK